MHWHAAASRKLSIATCRNGCALRNCSAYSSACSMTSGRITGMALLGDTDYTSCAAPQVDGACRTGNDFDARPVAPIRLAQRPAGSPPPVSYTHLRAHETPEH